jgi:hypothetical protein
VFNEVQGCGEHVAGVVSSELLARNAEGRARDTSGQEVYTCEVLMPDMAQILLDHVPMRPVLAEGGAILRLVFNSSSVMEAGHLKTEGLTTTTSAKFKDSETHV